MKTISRMSIYLFAYNILQSTGWLLLAAKLVMASFVWNFGTTSSFGAINATLMGETTVNGYLHNCCSANFLLFQTLALLEIVHSACGLISSSTTTICIQLIGRLSTFYILHFFDWARIGYGLLFVYFASSSSEIFRYTFYAFKQLNAVPAFIHWMRYNSFIVLYPLGFFGEMLVISSALEHLFWPLLFPFYMGFGMAFDHLYGHMFRMAALNGY